MARAIIVTDKVLLENRIFSSVKKVCEVFKLDYREVGDALREENTWENKLIKVSRSKIE